MLHDVGPAILPGHRRAKGRLHRRKILGVNRRRIGREVDGPFTSHAEQLPGPRVPIDPVGDEVKIP